MLTTMFYYNFYKPYMIDTFDNSNSKVIKKQRVAERAAADASQSHQILMNKSLKKDVVSYAKDVSSSVVGIKDSARDVGRDMEQLNRNIHKYDFDTAKSFIGDDLEEFTEEYNSATEFLLGQPHSRELSMFAEKLDEEVRSNHGRISQLGLTIDGNGKLSFNKEVFDKLDSSGISTAIGENLHLFSNMYQDANEALRIPLTEHMKFKNLGYYYNYKYGGMESDTFKIIESGMLVDRVV